MVDGNRCWLATEEEGASVKYDLFCGGTSEDGTSTRLGGTNATPFQIELVTQNTQRMNRKEIRVTYNAQAKTLKQPTPVEIKEVRKKAGLTQQQSAEMVHRADGARWREWEGDKYGIDLAVWELFLLKTGLRTLE